MEKRKGKSKSPFDFYILGYRSTRGMERKSKKDKIQDPIIPVDSEIRKSVGKRLSHLEEMGGHEE